MTEEFGQNSGDAKDVSMKNPPNTEVKKTLRRFVKDDFQHRQDSPTSFENILKPRSGGWVLRLCSLVFDLAVIGFVSMILICMVVLGCFCTSFLYTLGGQDASYISTELAARRVEKLRFRDELQKWRNECARIRGDAEYRKIDPDTVELPEEPKPQPLAPPVTEEFYSVTKPSVIDDVRMGFSLGSHWYYVKDNNEMSDLQTLKESRDKELFVCLSASEGSAKWYSAQTLSTYFNIAAVAAMIFAFAYMTIPMGLRSQTIGMWFFGIFIADQDDYTKEVLPLRAYCYCLLSIQTCFLTPFFVFFGSRSPAERICKVQVLRIAAAS